MQHGLAEKERVFRVFLIGESNCMQIRSANCLNKILKSIKITKLVESVCAVAYPFEVFSVQFLSSASKVKI